MRLDVLDVGYLVSVRTDGQWGQQDDDHPLFDSGRSITERDGETAVEQQHVVSTVQSLDA